MSVKVIPEPIRLALKKLPGVLPAWQFLRYAVPERIFRRRHAKELLLIEGLPLVTPSSGGSLVARAALTLKSANDTFPLLARLAENQSGFIRVEPLQPTSVSSEPEAVDAANALRDLFVSHCSDKSTRHDYHQLYGPLLRRPWDVSKILEIGIGTNNEDVVSNMSRNGTPGASLRAFRDFLPRAQVFGADVDARVLFQEERIATYTVDQTDATSLEQLGERTGEGFDLIIGDGLHAPNANLSVLIFAMTRVKPEGHIVIEDIPQEAAALWQVVGALMPANFECRLFKSRSALLFVARRRPSERQC
jgi:hypothetical protein